MFSLIQLTQATEAKIQLLLAENNKELKLIVGDNGNGIPKDVLDGKVNGMGLGNLKSRVNYLNGRLEIQSSGLGTRISIWVPLPLEAEKEGII
ncbi:ATP-binding protein [Aquiflexum lacus]|uniref:ATP-binding protein n=1 Tax=Aquiflexum lacus TaxID=2483805 RepID=UPI001892DA2D|nr:ATP-binding protein [Aquiflexum lacus]